MKRRAPRSTAVPTVAPYRRVKAHLAEGIEAGASAPGDRIPSEHALVRSLGVSRMTVQRALRELTAEGLVTRVQGVGTFVAAPPLQYELLEIRNIADEIRQRGHRHRCEVRKLAAVPAGPTIARLLGLRPRGTVYHSLLVHLEDGVPIQLEDRYVNPAVAREYLAVDFSRTTPNEYLTRVAPISEVEHVVEAIKPDRVAMRLLRLHDDEPCLRLYRRTWSAGVPASCAWLVHPGNLYRMVARFTPRPRRRG